MMALLSKLELIELPACRMIGIKVTNGGGENPVPALWEKCFRENTLQILEEHSPIMDYWIGWMGEHNSESDTFTYLAGMLLPVDTEAPPGFDYRDLPPCTVGNGYIEGSSTDGDVFFNAHQLTVSGITSQGYEPDYAYGWSAEAYATDLPFDAEEGTINYLCPCKRI